MNVYKNYIPDFKCSSDGNGKGVVSASVGLLNYDEVVYAGGYVDNKKNNYYLYNNNYFWIISPNGKPTKANGLMAWRIDSEGQINATLVNAAIPIRPVLVLNANTKILKGTGTSSDPFVVS